MSLRDRVVIITGAARGIGRYVARTFAAQGCKIVVADVAPAGTVLSELAALGVEALGVRTDVCDEDQVRTLMERTYARFGRIDVLVNNAAIVTHFHEGAPRWSRIRDMDQAFFRRVMDTNLGGTFLCTKHAIPYMESLNSGHIVNVGQGSLRARPNAGRPSSIGTCVYSTSKIALRAFTRGVAAEERDYNICVVSMGPGIGSLTPREARPGVAGGGGGVVTDDSPAWARGVAGRSVDTVGDRYVLAAQAPMELSGEQLAVEEGKLVIVTD